jgi:Periplasmic binding protein
MDALTDPKQRSRLEPATFARRLPSVTYFRMGPTDQSQGPAAAVFMRRDLRLGTFFAVDDGTAYGRMLTTAMSAYGTHRLGLRLAGSAHLRLGDPASVHGLIADVAGVIAARNPDGVYCACDQTIAPDFARSLRLRGYRNPLVGNDASFEGSTNWMGLKGRDFATAVDIPPETPALETFRHIYRARFHQAADPAGLAAYEAAAIALNALYDAGTAGRLRGTDPCHASRRAPLCGPRTIPKRRTAAQFQREWRREAAQSEYLRAARWPMAVHDLGARVGPARVRLLLRNHLFRGMAADLRSSPQWRGWADSAGPNCRRGTIADLPALPPCSGRTPCRYTKSRSRRSGIDPTGHSAFCRWSVQGR